MIVIVISVLVIVLIGLAELRNKPVLQKQVPLHPSTLIVSHCLKREDATVHLLFQTLPIELLPGR